jgi:hypothetical protein
MSTLSILKQEAFRETETYFTIVVNIARKGNDNRSAKYTSVFTTEK